MMKPCCLTTKPASANSECGAGADGMVRQGASCRSTHCISGRGPRCAQSSCHADLVGFGLKRYLRYQLAFPPQVGGGAGWAKDCPEDANEAHQVIQEMHADTADPANVAFLCAARSVG